MALVLLRAYSTLGEADGAGSFLQAHGIAAFRFDPEEFAVTIQTIGIPPRLMVAEEDLDEAAALLASVED